MSQTHPSRQYMIACDKGGSHQGEYAKYVCVKKECMNLDPIICEVCRTKGHRNHRVMPIRDFFTQVNHRLNSQRIKDYANIKAVVEEAEKVCHQSFLNLKYLIYSKMKSYEQILVESFTNWKENVSLFDEHHSLQVINDIKSMQKESDISIFSQQVKKILPFIKFDVPEDGMIKPPQTPQQAANTHIKSITNDILGLPPLSKSEVYGFQQNYLTSLKKISDNITQQFSQISFSRPNNNTNSLLNRTQFSQPQRIQEESFISQLDANTTFLENLTPMNQQRNKQSLHHQNSLIPDISPLNQNINDNASSKFIPQQNGHSQFYQVNNGTLNQNNSNLNLNNNNINTQGKSYQTPKGTYRAVDLIQHHKGQESSNNAASHKRFNSASGFSGQKSLFGQNELNTNQSEQNLQGFQVIDSVQRQVDEIQKSLNHLRNSFDFQKILQLMDDKSPIRNQTKNNQTEQSQNPNPSKQSKNNTNQQQANFFNSGNQQNNQVVSGTNILNTNTASTGQLQGFTQATSDETGKRSLFSASHHQLNSIAQSQAKIERPLSFSEKFQRFRENSKNLSRENSLNNSYQRFNYDSEQQQLEKEEEAEKEQNRKKNQNHKRVKFQFSQDLKHQFVDVSKYIAQGQKDSYTTRLVLLEPTVEIIPVREITFSFLIKSCRNMEFGQPLALGLCHKNIVHQNNFEFPQKEETGIKEAISPVQGQGSAATQHGCYLLTSTGYLRNHAYSKQDMKKVPIRFNTQDVIICHFNPFRKTLKFTKKSSGESCVLNVDTLTNDKLYPCVRISYAQDCVEYIHE